jgi:rod shape-determining protein MreD
MISTKLALSVIAALVLQLLIARYLRFAHLDLGYVDPVLIVTVYTSFGRNPLLTMLVGTTAGLAQDSFSGGVFGSQGFTKTVIGFIVGSLSVRIALENVFSRLVVMTGASILNGLIFVGLQWLFWVNVVPNPVLGNLARRLGWELLANFIGAVIIFRLLDRLLAEDVLGRERKPLRVKPRRLA